MTSGQASRMGGWWATLSFFEDLRWGYLLPGRLHASEHRSRHLQVSMPIARPLPISFSLCLLELDLC